MAKPKSLFFCSSCGFQHNKLLGKCYNCNSWGTILEEVVDSKKNTTSSKLGLGTDKPKRLDEITVSGEKRISTGVDELDTVLGGGCVRGSVVLVGGEPGIGKSTLMLHLSLNINDEVLYISGEESLSQIKVRANRLGNQSSNCLFLDEVDLNTIIGQIKSTNPKIVIIDSIQTVNANYLESPSGSISQIRECAHELIRLAKKKEIGVFLVGHINKEGNIAGPKVLEHMVDVVLQFEGDRNNELRILRSTKNRFGSTNELGLFEMISSGLKEVHNPSELLVTKTDEPVNGSAIAVTMEGARAMLVEIQALVSPAVYGVPQRSTTGYDSKRLNMILAVLEKRAGFALASKDVFLNITGGIKTTETSLDLAVVVAILSSNFEIEIPDTYGFSAEVGLNGEIRMLKSIEKRILEAQRLGYSKIYISTISNLDLSKFKIEVIRLSKIEDLVAQLFQ